MTNRVIVTGAGGFLGSHIANYFCGNGYRVAAVGRCNAASIDSSYSNFPRLYGMTLPDARFVAAVKEFKPDLVVHCAGTASVGESVHDPYGDFQRMVDVCAFTLETLRTCSPGSHFCLLSSAAVYGNPLHLPVSEHDLCKPVSSYGYHKLLCETLAEEYAKLHGLKVTVLRIFSAYGERLWKQVIHDLCYKFLRDEFRSAELFGSGEESRDFIHAVDVARAIHCLYENGSDGIYNVASGNQTTIKALAALIQLKLGSRKDIVFTGVNRAGDPLYWQANVSKLQSVGYRQSISLPEGIERYCEWFKNTYAGFEGEPCET